MRIDIKGTIIPNDDAWVYDWFEIDCTCPKAVNEALTKADGQNIDVYINSGGGDIFAGSEIYSALRSYNGKVDIHITGLAASAASVIACAGHSDISPTAMMMVHNVSSCIKGDYHDMDKESEVLQKANQAICSAYMDKCGITEQEALLMMDKETWMTAQDAVDMGLVDEIATSKNLQLIASVGEVLPRAVIDKIKNEVNSPAEKSDFYYAKEKLNLLKLKGALNNEF